MIQDIYPSVFDNQYKNILPSSDDFICYFSGRSVLIRKEENVISFPHFSDLSVEEREVFQGYYLFRIDNQSFFLAKGLTDIPEGFTMEDINIFRDAEPKSLAFALITAYGLANWYHSHVYCGRCSCQMEHHEKERMLKCPACNHSEYPKISPAVIVGVTNGNRILLSKYANREYTNYALLAGFAEIGESIEETVHREIQEEVGLQVKNLTFYKSQPWSFTDCLLMGFFAEVDGEDMITLDKEELALAEWFEREDVPPGNAELSLTGEMIEYFRKGLNKQ